MLSSRLWQTIAEVDIHDPIFRRASQIHRPAARAMPRAKRPGLLWLVVAIALALALIKAPQLLALVLVVPVCMITLLVMAPLFLPAVVWLAGALATGGIISGIYREKQQYTYDLLCTSTQGKLKASWSFASGLLHRGGGFFLLRWATRNTLRIGLAALVGLALFVILFAVVNRSALGVEQLRLLALPLLILAVYATNLTQTFALSHIIGLLASSFDWAKRDAMLAGALAYALLNSLPLALAALVYFAFQWRVFEPQVLALLAAEAIALLLIIGLREAAIVLLWRALKRRMNSSRFELGTREVRSALAMT